MGFVQDIADELGEDPETIEKALWLQDHIKREGIDATRFMRKSSLLMRKVGPGITSKHVQQELEKRL